MNSEGLTLIELLIGVVIVGILGLALGSSFTGSIAGNRIEGQTKELYSDLVTAQTRAKHYNRNYFVVITTNGYQMIEDTNRNLAIDPTPIDTILFSTAKTLLDPVMGAAAGSMGPGTITFNTTGSIVTPVLPTPPAPLLAIRFDVTNAEQVTTAYDCIQLQRTRIKMGLWNGGQCNAQ